MFLGQSGMPGASILWKSRAPTENKLFLWLAMQDCCWTKYRLHRHDLTDDASCSLCLQIDETMDHMLVGCVYSREVMFLLFRRCDWLPLISEADDSLVDWWLQARERVPNARRPAFDTLILQVTRCIWLERNARVFKATTSSAAQLVGTIGRLVDDWSNARLIFRSLLFRE
jgi:hypothetical protein